MLKHVLWDHLQAQGKMCGSEAYGCHKERISCTSYRYCSIKEECLNPFINREKSVGTNEGCSVSGVDQDKSEDIDEDDDVDSPDLCEDQPRPAPTEKWCYVDCPVDCEVTRWTLWNTSECLCGNTVPTAMIVIAASTMMRYRYIVTNPSEKGRPCPLPLIQHKPCPAVPCYTWDRGDWDTCTLHATWCGHGTVHRNITCLRGSLPVESRLCGATTLDLKTEDSCYVPSRMEADYIGGMASLKARRPRQSPASLAPWGDPGFKHFMSFTMNITDCLHRGYQTRSRAVLKPPNIGGEPCPTALWETRPCFTGPCLTFDWAVDDDGQLTCRRSDGVVVIDGEHVMIRPWEDPEQFRVLGNPLAPEHRTSDHVVLTSLQASRSQS
uniref:Uncharacterized protein n=1 Tax=Timema monikensis TaxID=170555 RepID=A0A7R9E2P3_9NEOP|nr:unnamed protein product [Timema monikensis]